ncbi:MAG: DUF4167 domain-containing protein [Sphingobium sp.]|uniref:DUF4167 domain-containing protein n=1 Tax=Sphingobium sp. TaxID=1912891 RepID=UPI00299FD040|nr:DUF4167 domain-containing protein [Sphingobium sp.]MDX3911496.1 DUF4167 domain-containing protein [Sphingobium sp.]
MINNRQAGRRNRGRNNNNNGRPGGQNRGGGDNGNRIDNRSRGNAAQLLEKYRNMARDAQLSGDRVNAEYYLQFADHYFRVLADNRARQEEAQGIQQQQRQQRPWDPESDGDDFESADGNSEFEDRPGYAPQGNGSGNRDNSNRDNSNREGGNREQGQRDYNQREQVRREGGQRDNGPREGQRDQNRDNYGRNGNRRDRPQHQPVREDAEVEAAAPAYEPVAEAPREEGVQPRRGRGRPPRDRSAPAVPEVVEAAQDESPVVTEEVAEASRARRVVRQRRPREEAVSQDEPAGLDLTVLPPAISRGDNDGAEAATEETPRKRTRRVRPAAEAAE